MGLFALCKENATILATIEDGASLTSITAGVAGNVNNYNYVYPSFVIRGSETLEMFGTTGNEANLPIVEPAPYDHPLTVRYTFLDAAHSGYVGVATPSSAKVSNICPACAKVVMAVRPRYCLPRKNLVISTPVSTSQ